jgi:hypothetical protein
MARRGSTASHEVPLLSNFPRRVVRASLSALALVALTRVAEAQQPEPCGYDACALRMQYGGLLGARVVQGATAVKAEGSGWFSHSIPLFESRSDSVHLHYAEYRSNATRAGILGILGALASSVGLAIVDHPSHDNRVLKISLISGGAIVGLIAGINRARSQNHVQRAIWLYNRDLAR